MPTPSPAITASIPMAMPACCFERASDVGWAKALLWSSTSKHLAFYFRDAAAVIHQGPYRNLYSDGLTILVTANRHNRLRQCARSCVDIPREAPPMASMRLRRDDQFNRISNCLKFGKSEEALGGGVPMANRSISADPDDCCHSLSSVNSLRASPATAIGVQHKPARLAGLHSF